MDGTPWAEWTPGSEAPVFEPGAPGWGRRLPIGAEIRPEGGVDFRVWAPDRHRVEIAIESGPGARGQRPRVIELTPAASGYFAGTVETAAAGTRYRYRLDGGPGRPDPASRFQPDGPHDPSRVIDPAAFPWTDREWPGVRLIGQTAVVLAAGPDE